MIKGVCPVTRSRIKIALYAYAYEIENNPLVSDAEYDKMSQELDITSPTKCPIHDKFFREEYEPHTSQWIYKHPNLERLQEIYNMVAKTDII